MKETYEEYTERVRKKNLNEAKAAQSEGKKLDLFQQKLLIMDKYGLEMGDTVLIKMLHTGHEPNWDNYHVVHRAHIEKVMKNMSIVEITTLISGEKQEDTEMNVEHRASSLAQMIEDMKERYFCRILIDAFLKEGVITEEEADLHWDKAYGGKFNPLEESE